MTSSRGFFADRAKRATPARRVADAVAAEAERLGVQMVMQTCDYTPNVADLLWVERVVGDRGAGAAAIDALTAAADAAGVTIWLHVFHDAPGLRRLYFDRGWRPDADDGDGDLVMVRAPAGATVTP